MAVQKPIKHLVIEMHFREMRDFDAAIEKIRSNIRLGVQESKEVKEFSSFEHGMCYLKEFDCRIDDIDGVEHFIIPSKMNKQLDFKYNKYLGVTWSNDVGKFRSSIFLKGKTKHLGYFSDKDEAAKAFQEALKEKQANNLEKTHA